MEGRKSFIVQYPPQYGVVKSRLDDSNNFEKTLFPNVYSGCRQSVANIIRHNGGHTEDGCPSSLHGEESTIERHTDELFVNPIIAITGSRGSGKSSAMQSFAQYLKDQKHFKNCTFSVLPAIDATQFGKNESVIGNITASMYREYSHDNFDIPVDKKREFVRLASEVNNTAVMYSTGEWFKCGDDLLQDSEKVGNLRKRLHELIMNYLNLHSDRPTHTNKYLVIMLDDLDMCSAGAFTIIEEIRKFLCIRNVVILMTMQSTQLRTVLQASHINAFGKVDKDTEPKIQRISMELAFRSYEKLFPASRCHAMPVWNADQLKTCELYIAGIDQEKMEQGKLDPYDCLNKETRSILLNRTLHMVWRKTLLIPVCSQDGEHLLIPNNLRSLHNFIAMFCGMEDVFTEEFYKGIAGQKKKMAEQEKADQTNKGDLPFDLIPGLKGFNAFATCNYVNKPILEKNLTIFENYLLDNLSTYGESLNHNAENQILAETLLNLILEMHTVPLERLNAKIVGDILESQLPTYLKDAFKNIKSDVKIEGSQAGSDAKDGAKKDGDEKDSEAYYLKKAVAYADSISIGDVLYVLGKISVKTRCRYIAYLIEVIRTMWSIRMTAEFYIHGETSGCSYIVSKAFRRTVGGLMVDANTTAFTGASNLNDWYEYRDGGDNKYDDLFFATSIDMKSNCKALAKDCLNYRDRNVKGEPYYTNSDLGTGTGKKVCHYMAHYTNALDDSKNRVIYFPFNSLDFMYRFYEEFRGGCRKLNMKKEIPAEAIFVELDTKKITSMENVLKSVAEYIPISKVDPGRMQISATEQISGVISKKVIDGIHKWVNNGGNTDLKETVALIDLVVKNQLVKGMDRHTIENFAEIRSILGKFDEKKAELDRKIDEINQKIEQINSEKDRLDGSSNQATNEEQEENSKERKQLTRKSLKLTRDRKMLAASLSQCFKESAEAIMNNHAAFLEKFPNEANS